MAEPGGTISCRASASWQFGWAGGETGEIRPIALVTYTGPCFKAARFAALIEKRPELIHIRTRRKSPNPKRCQGARLRPPQVRAPVEVHLEAINDHQTIKSTEPESLPLS